MQLEDTLLLSFYGTAIVALIAYTVQAVRAVLPRRTPAPPKSVAAELTAMQETLDIRFNTNLIAVLELHAGLYRKLTDVCKYIDERTTKIMDETQKILDQISALNDREDDLFDIINGDPTATPPTLGVMGEIINLKGELAAALAANQSVDVQAIHDKLDALITKTSAEISSLTPAPIPNPIPPVTPPPVTVPDPGATAPAPVATTATDATPTDATPVDVNAVPPTSTP